MNTKSIRKIAMIAAAAVALTTGAAFGNSNTPTVQPQRHDKSAAVIATPSRHGVTIGVYSHGSGVAAKHHSPRWR
jgi:uncharacterized protein with FMN-binding domain